MKRCYSGYQVTGASPAFSRDFGFQFSTKSISTNGKRPSVFLGVDTTNHIPAYVPAVKDAFKNIGIDTPLVTFKQTGLTGDLIVLVRERL